MNEPGVGEVKQSEVGRAADLFLKACGRHQILAATAESCTGGLIIAAMTDIPGSSSMVEMAAGALARSHAGIALAVTGIAGPDGGSPGKPVGLVWFGLALKGREPSTEKCVFENRGRDYIRRKTVLHALEMGLKALSED